MNTITAMTEERMNRCMGNVMRQYDQGLLNRNAFDAEMFWILNERRKTLRDENGLAIDKLIKRFQRGFITQDEMIINMWAQEIKYEDGWH